MKKKTTVIILLAVLVVALAVVTVLLLQSRRENREMQELFALDKEEMENEYTNFANQYNELQIRINNDSLQQRLEAEELKTRRLLEELRQTKATDAVEIKRLKKELSTMRAVLKSYVVQIDSLNAVNQNLSKENKKVRAQYSEAARRITDLSQEKQELSEKVTLASQLDAVGLLLTAQRKNGKEAKKLKEAVKLTVRFTLTKNITATTGEKTIFVRMTKPGGELLTKNAGNTFPYENQEIGYSMKKYIEYTGEEQVVTLYWEIEEFLSAGEYGVYLFADGVMIGSGSFRLN